MKIFVGQAVTGEDIGLLNAEFARIQSALNHAGHSCYCTLLADRSAPKKPGEWLHHALEQIDAADAYCAVVRSDKKSEGMLIEVGYVLARKKRFIVAVHQDVDTTYLPELADTVVRYTDIDDLCRQLERILG